MAGSVSLGEFPDGDAGFAGDHNMKKVHFKYPNSDSDMKMVDRLSPMAKLSWKEMLGKGIA
ncbi:hypothetical protein PVK06_034114 [Gossypium arboreum]|uniref:Uncharacterized protein n=1 Tax=Gossypium arboreum TaxID=29729 RepID=A0ABR0NE78_GOSAR|nr:hypothetical protein PVK06_034114 [Gossypium arboreum]